MTDPAIIPVLDIMAGELVAAMGGDRMNYRPLKSPLLPSADPADGVRALTDKFGFNLFYVADLDAIMGRPPNRGALEKMLTHSRAEFWLDAGYSAMDQAPRDEKRIIPIMATETFRAWDNPGDLSGAVVSMDSFHGRYFCLRAGMPCSRAMEIFRAAGAKKFIHMRLDAVGSGGFSEFKLIPPRPGEQWYAAGGFRGPEDYAALKRAGYAGALAATALHRGKFDPA